MATVYEIQTRQVDCVKRYPAEGVLKDISWSAEGQKLLLTYAGKDTSELYAYRHGEWELEALLEKPADSRTIEIEIEEGLNDPPVLVARDRATGKRRVIFDPNPQLANIDLGEAREYRWRDSANRVFTGGLVLPPEYDATRRYPLVIQTHGLNGHEFLRTGGTETSHAARALAARGLIVLQVLEPYDAITTIRESREDGMAVYVAAIDQLAAEGVINPDKVGISAFSRTGPYAGTAITKAPERFAAVAFSNTEPGTIMGFFAGVDYGGSGFLADFYNLVGAGEPPYGDGLARWLEHSPGFNSERINSPVLFCAGDPQHLLGVWGMYSMLRAQGKPVELQYIRSGQHNLTKPLQRLAHQEMLVDWFDFWLNDHEDDAAAKAAQYARWRALRSRKLGAGSDVPAVPLPLAGVRTHSD